MSNTADLPIHLIRIAFRVVGSDLEFTKTITGRGEFWEDVAGRWMTGVDAQITSIRAIEHQVLDADTTTVVSI